MNVFTDLHKFTFDTDTGVPRINQPGDQYIDKLIHKVPLDDVLYLQFTSYGTDPLIPCDEPSQYDVPSVSSHVKHLSECVDEPCFALSSKNHRHVSNPVNKKNDIYKKVAYKKKIDKQTSENKRMDKRRLEHVCNRIQKKETRMQSRTTREKQRRQDRQTKMFKLTDIEEERITTEEQMMTDSDDTETDVSEYEYVYDYRFQSEYDEYDYYDMYNYDYLDYDVPPRTEIRVSLIITSH